MRTLLLFKGYPSKNASYDYAYKQGPGGRLIRVPGPWRVVSISNSPICVPSGLEDMEPIRYYYAYADLVLPTVILVPVPKKPNFSSRFRTNDN